MKNSIINSNPNLPFAGLYKTKFETAMSSNLHIPLSLKLPEILFYPRINNCSFFKEAIGAIDYILFS